MYQLALATTQVPVKNFFAITETCAIKGEEYPAAGRANKKSANKMIIHPAVPEIMDQFSTLDEAISVLRKKENLISYQQKYHVYLVKEYFIQDENEQIVQILPKFRLVSEHGDYSTREFMAMRLILEEMDELYTFATLIAFEKYGFLFRSQDENGKPVIQYEDVRKIATCDLETMVVSIQPKIFKNQKESEEEQ